MEGPSRAQTPDNAGDTIPSTHSTPTKTPNANGKRIMIATSKTTPPKSEECADVLPVPKQQGAATR